MKNNNRLAGSGYMTQEAHPMLRDHLEKWDGVCGGGLKREGVYVYLWLIHIIVQHILKKLKVTLKNNIYIYQNLMLYTLNILQFYFPILSQTILSLLVTIHDI